MSATARTVLFVCPHGAAKSRLAAALFNANPPAGWHATTAAGEQPAAHINPAVAPLPTGTAAAAHLDISPPRPLAAASEADILVAIDCDAPPGARHWGLTTTVMDAALCDELRGRVAGLRTSIAGTSPLRA